jgi:activator of HSP90 ATPase
LVVLNGQELIPHSKLQVFQQIVIDSKRAISEHRAGIPTEDKLVRPGEADEGNAVSSSSPSSSKQDPGSSASSEASTSASGTGSSTGAPTPRGAISNTVNAATGSTWERLRTTRPAPPQADTPEEELHRQQAEFDAMIERERRGGDGLDRWK